VCHAHLTTSRSHSEDVLTRPIRTAANGCVSHLALVAARHRRALPEIGRAARISCGRADSYPDSLVPFVRSVLFCNEVLGLGHLRRSLAIADALAARDEHSLALVVTGFAGYSGARLPPRVDVLKLPVTPVSVDRAWSATALAQPAQLSISPDQVMALRAELSLAAVRVLDPDVVVVDYAPLGRWQELRPALDWLRARGRSTVALGLRALRRRAPAARAGPGAPARARAAGAGRGHELARQRERAGDPRCPGKPARSHDDADHRPSPIAWRRPATPTRSWCWTPGGLSRRAAGASFPSSPTGDSKR
jgi:hypothetical protein